ncbi:hypothetical protein SMC26_04705 [Actinomadura fulvescens]|uniref:Secreted protein n=1 Tax=Actinomadura fulvescens TaxID=46160 RepID=A0ABN3PS40_9ACTN
MRTFLKRTLIAPAVLLLVSLPGVSASADTAVTFINIGPVSFTNLNTGATVSCATSILTGDARPFPDPVITFNTASFQDCDGDFLLFHVTASGLPWGFYSTSYDPTTDTVFGQPNDTSVRVEASDGCVATVSGSVSASYANPGGTFSLNGGGTLEVKATNGLCDPSLINVGDQYEAQGDYQASPMVVIRP